MAAKKSMCSSAMAIILSALVCLGVLLVVFLDITDGGIRRYWPTPTFSAKDIPDLQNQVYIVTGANTGIGKETAIELARKRATVVLGCRTSCDDIALQLDGLGGKGISLSLDLGDMTSIYNFYKRFKSLQLPLHGLILNAGVMAKPEFSLTKDGFEMQLGVNWIGHFFLQGLLQDTIEASAPSRIVIVSAKAHEVIQGPLLPSIEESLMDTPESRRAYHPVRNYALSKTLNILHARELARRMRVSGKKVSVLSVHPGVIQTELSRHVVDVIASYIGHSITQRIAEVIFSVLLSSHEGALTQLYAATSPEVDEKDLNGAYVRPLVRTASASSVASDEANAKRAWKDALAICQGFMNKIDHAEPLPFFEELSDLM